MFGIKKQSEDKEILSNRQKVKKNLEKIILSIKKNKDYSKNKEEILNNSKETNKEEILNNFIEKVEVFNDYTIDEEEDKKIKFPIDSWVDSFFENE